MKLKLYYSQRRKLEKLIKKEEDVAQLKRYRILLCRHRGLSYEAIYQARYWGQPRQRLGGF